MDPDWTQVDVKNNRNRETGISVAGGFFKFQCLGRALVSRLAPRSLVSALK
jgi:hypothetical protein